MLQFGVDVFTESALRQVPVHSLVRHALEKLKVKHFLSPAKLRRKYFVALTKSSAAIIFTHVVIRRTGKGLVKESFLQHSILKTVDSRDVVERGGLEGGLKPRVCNFKNNNPLLPLHRNTFDM